MKTQSGMRSTGYRIGAVAKLTGISPDALRVWERRYAVVKPGRTSSGGRLYSDDDIARLRLMKQLVDAGDSIGTIATLTHEELEARIGQVRPVAVRPLSAGPCKLVVVGETMVEKMKAEEDALADVSLVASYANAQAYESRAGDIKADVLLIEQATLQSDTAIRLVDLIARVKASCAIVVYRFAAQETLERLPHSRCIALRAPVDARTIQRQCMTLLEPRAGGSTPEAEQEVVQYGAVLPRRYDDATLAKLATVSTTVKCECPRHLAELITGLSAFEQYSTECESRDAKDAALHAYLNATASRARHMIESALDTVIQAESIEL